MATAYGAWHNPGSYNAYRAVIDYSVSSTGDTQASVTVTVKCQMGSGHDGGFNFTATATANGSQSQAGSGYYSAGGTYTMLTRTVAVARTHSAQQVAVSGRVANGYGWPNTSSTASATVTVPARPSYAVTYNANGGTGAPAGQTKWHSEALALSLAEPEREGYDFVGWATSADAASASWQPGDAYSANAPLSLYAVWEASYMAPSMGALSAWRCGEGGAEDEEGTRCRVSASWSVDTSLTPGNSAESLSLRWREVGGGDWQEADPVALAGESGTTEAWLARDGTPVELDADLSWQVLAEVADSSGRANNTAARTVTLARALFPVNFSPTGTTFGLPVEMAGGLTVGGSRALVEPVALYESAGGTTGAVPLSESARRFARVEVAFGTDVGVDARKAVSAYAPYGYGVCLDVVDVTSDGSTAQWAFKTYAVADDGMSLVQGAFERFVNWSSSSSDPPTHWTRATIPHIRVYGVYGYEW